MILGVIKMHFLVVAALFVSPAASAASPDSAGLSPKPVKAKKICKIDPASNGSRMTKSICFTAEQWEERNKSGKSVEDVKAGLVR